MPGARVFLLSPAHLGGERARILLRDEASFDLATRVRARGGAPVGEIFAFLSGLYFRGKLAYVSAFGAAPHPEVAPAYVITSNRGLCTVDARFDRRALQELGTVDIDARNDAYRKPLVRDAKKLQRRIGEAEVVLLGSIASTKYTEVLGEIFGDRLVSPVAFVGLGDMSRGSIMLKAARAGVELPYAAVRALAGAKVRSCRAR
ncbi:MAG TPA: hypothetical protein VN947_24245 [Polyangia bacterium]|nr:hypothetical protein [Polyangia bacterium]